MEFKADPKPAKTHNLIMPQLDLETPWGFFDG